METLSEIEAKVNGLAALIGAAGHHALPTYGRTEDGARPHIEVDDRGYHFVVVERGQERTHHVTRELDELLYRIFEGVTFSLACNYEVTHRSVMQDCRRLIFQRQVELLGRLDTHWADEEAQRHARILEEHPLDDLAGVRATLTGKLRAEGHSPEAAWHMACERYPSPSP